MPNQLVSLIMEYRLVIMSGILLLIVLGLKKKANGNKFLFILAGALAVSIIYELVMDEPVSRLATRINRSLEQPGPTESTNPHYYESPEKRYTLPEGH